MLLSCRCGEATEERPAGGVLSVSDPHLALPAARSPPGPESLSGHRLLPTGPLTAPSELQWWVSRYHNPRANIGPSAEECRPTFPGKRREGESISGDCKLLAAGWAERTESLRPSVSAI